MTGKSSNRFFDEKIYDINFCACVSDDSKKKNVEMIFFSKIKLRKCSSDISLLKYSEKHTKKMQPAWSTQALNCLSSVWRYITLKKNLQKNTHTFFSFYT